MIHKIEKVSKYHGFLGSFATEYYDVTYESGTSRKFKTINDKIHGFIHSHEPKLKRYDSEYKVEEWK